MKNIVLRDDFSEFEIRPEEEFSRYLELIREDIKEILNSDAGKNFNYCPACKNSNSKILFEKETFIYRECSRCATVFLSPRPTRKMLHDFFFKSKALKYWNSKIMQETENRKMHVFNPRIRWVQDTIEFNDSSNKVFCDFYSKYTPFLKSMDKMTEYTKKVSYKPAYDIRDDIKLIDFEITEELAENSCSIITAFEVFDRFYNPRSVLDVISKSLENSGMLFLTTTSSSGLDIQLLKEKSRSLIPPIHLNIFSVEGVVLLLEEFGFEILELSTPGSLDIHLIEKELHNVEIPKFISDIIINRNNQIKESFQEFLQRSMLSSHMRIAARLIKNI